MIQHKKAYITAVSHWLIIIGLIPASMYIHKNVFNVFIMLTYIAGFSAIVSINNAKYIIETMFKLQGIQNIESEIEQYGTDTLFISCILFFLAFKGYIIYTICWMLYLCAKAVLQKELIIIKKNNS